MKNKNSYLKIFRNSVAIFAVLITMGILKTAKADTYTYNRFYITSAGRNYPEYTLAGHEATDLGNMGTSNTWYFSCPDDAFTSVDSVNPGYGLGPNSLTRIASGTYSFTGTLGYSYFAANTGQLYSSETTDHITVDCGDSFDITNIAPNTNTNIQITYPGSSNLSVPISDFNFWNVQISGIASSSQGEYGSLLQMSYCNVSAGCLATLYDNGQFFGGDGNTTTYSLAKGASLSNGTWHAQATLYENLSPTSIILGTSTKISFTITNSFANPSIPGVISTTTAPCIAPEGGGWDLSSLGESIGYGFCSIGATFFGNQVPGYQFMQSEWQDFQAVPPFVFFFSIASSTNNAASNANSSQQNLVVTIPIGENNVSFNVLTANTLTQMFITSGNGHNIPACDSTCAQAKHDLIFLWLTNTFWTITGLLTLYMVL